MVEFTVSIQSLHDLKMAKEPWNILSEQNKFEKEASNIFFSEWSKIFSKKNSPERVYFGSEFCQYRLSSIAVVKKALEYSWDNGMEFTYVTPFTHNQNFQSTDEI